MTDREIRRLLESVRTIAVVGLSPSPARASHQVAAYLQRAGYRVIPVNPGHDRLLGEPCFPSLGSVPDDQVLDLVDVFRRPEHVAAVVAEAVERGVGGLWLQLGCGNREAEARAAAAGLAVVSERCLKTEHRRLLGTGGHAGAS